MNPRASDSQIVLETPDDNQLYINHWIDRTRQHETIDRRYDHRVPGRQDRYRQPRWNIGRDVPGWVG